MAVRGEAEHPVFGDHLVVCIEILEAEIGVRIIEGQFGLPDGNAVKVAE